MNEVERVGRLWIVATPIGALDDLAPRASEVLRGADVLLAEDTRRTGRLLVHAGIESRGRLRSFHEHNEDRQLSRVLDELHAGKEVAILSDAGTPVLSDPGFALVRAAREEGVPVASVPGPSCFTAALAASGQPPLPSTLVGFLPSRVGPRRSRIAELAAVPWTMVVLLSPHRLAAELADLAAGLGSQRRGTLLAELSKRHERAVTAPLGELAKCDESRRPRGEYVVVIGPADRPDRERPTDPGRIREVYDAALDAGLSRKEAIKSTAATLGVGRRRVFDSLVDHETDVE